MEITIEGGGLIGGVCGRTPAGWWPPRLTWAALVELEHALASIEATVALLGRRPRTAEWRLIRATLGHHVGWDSRHAGHPVLGSGRAYDAALSHLEHVAGCRRRGR